MTSPDKEFKMRGGSGEQASLYNRIAAIKRIEYLTGVDLHKRSSTYLFMFDLEMYQRWYKDMPKEHIIDEEWCQRASEVVKGLEVDREEIDKNEEVAIRVASAYKSHLKTPKQAPERPLEALSHKKKSLFGKLINKIRRKK